MSINSKTVKRTKKSTKFSNEQIFRVNAEGELIPINASVIEEEWEEDIDINWDKIWLANALDALECIGTKKIAVANYMLKNKDKSNNVIFKTQREIAEDLNISTKTVTATLKALEEANFLVGKPGYYQINPDKVCYGGHNKRMAILRVYNQRRSEKTVEQETNKEQEKND